MFTKRHEEELAEIKALTVELGQRFDEILAELAQIKQAQARLGNGTPSGKPGRRKGEREAKAARGAKAAGSDAGGTKTGRAKAAGAKPRRAKASPDPSRRRAKEPGLLAGQAATRRKAAKRGRAPADRNPGAAQE